MEINEYISRMEAKYGCTDEFKNRMRIAIAGIFAMEVCPVTRLTLLKQAEKTYATHATNQQSVVAMKTEMKEGYDRLVENVNIMTEKLQEEEKRLTEELKKEYTGTVFDISLE